MGIPIRIALFSASFVLMTWFSANPLTPTQNVGIVCAALALNGSPVKKDS